MVDELYDLFDKFVVERLWIFFFDLFYFFLDKIVKFIYEILVVVRFEVVWFLLCIFFKFLLNFFKV